ncbi:alpha/beta hydrolase [Phytomonospora sp. NPDC050363]|uniref:alpha/beta fold hydrolase n=1 Tax=Phytomonospora sp. NPDC050363 TaxID=3155642 RepID=UPI0034087772
MSERMIDANGAELCVETFGDPSDPVVLLIGGGASSMDWWQKEFCALLAEDRHVIRYDLRDTGRSVSYPAGKPGYTHDDLAEDAVGILDALAIETACLAGISLGGGIAQRAAVAHPDRVSSLVLMSTSPGGPGGPGNDLPPMTPEVAASFASEEPGPDTSTKEGLFEAFLLGERMFAGARPVDEEELRELSYRVFARTKDIPASLYNHFAAAAGEEVRPRLGEIKAPTLVVHGTHDPLFPLGHAEALAREIPGARLLPLEGVGHQMPPKEFWGVVVAGIREVSGG